MNTREFENIYDTYKSCVEQNLRNLFNKRQPASVYKPIRYVIDAGGKRVRAVLVLCSCAAVGGTTSHALPAATAIEILHNFTLVHDDVMDNASTRRGKPTVHKRWDQNVAILAGDQMVAFAYQSLLRSNSPDIRAMLRTFTDAFVTVCDGQGFDKEFESERHVSLHQYFAMIKKKTARVISAAAELGGIVGGGSSREISALRTFGEELGVAFQIQDDLLDITGNQEKFGKSIGGDLVEKKKTYMLLTALDRVRKTDRAYLQSLLRQTRIIKQDIKRVRALYFREGVVQSALDEIARRTVKAKKALTPLTAARPKEMLLWLADQLLERQR